ncbi:Glycine cleavage system transcriptional activator [compost metagenome]
MAGGEVDAAIRYGRGGWPGVQSTLLMTERLSVVCAPSLVAGRRRLRAPADLLRHPLLVSHARQPFEWDAWARRHGLDLGRARTVRLHDYNIVVEAALAGQGFAMGRHRLIAPQLASGALVPALPGSALEDPRIGWWLVTPRGALSAPVQVLRDWLMQAAAESDEVGTH